MMMTLSGIALHFVLLCGCTGSAKPNAASGKLSANLIVSGRVVDSAGAGVVGVRLLLNGVPNAKLTDINGRFSIVVPRGWSGILKPEQAPLSFVPPEVSVTNIQANLTTPEIVAAARRVAIRGRISTATAQAIAGIRVVAHSEANAVSAEGFSNATGEYRIEVPVGWSGTVSPDSSTTSEYVPVDFAFDALAADVVSTDFTLVLREQSLVVGHVYDTQNRPVPSLGLRFVNTQDPDEEPIQIVSAADGSFGFPAPAGWQGQADCGPDYRVVGGPDHNDATHGVVIEAEIKVARNYFVSPAGSDAAGGTFLAPLRSIQKAVDLAGPGDAILIRGGTYDMSNDSAYRLNVIAFRKSGQPGLPIVVEGYGDEVVTLKTRESKPIFDFTATYGNQTAGFGHYEFRKLRIAGGRYGWMFRPAAPTNWRPNVNTIDELLVGQIHDVTIEDCEVDGSGMVESAIYVRYAGVRNLIVRRCDFHHTIGTEGTVDIGEWSDEQPGHSFPRSASHGLVFEDCAFHHAQHQQANGIVFQPCIYDVTLRQCRAWNNGKYGFACKGSGNFRIDRCAAWGNDSTQMYCRGFGGDSGAERPSFNNDFLITNSIFISPADQRGGAALNWRENANLQVYQSTILGLRDSTHGEAGGYSFELGHHHLIPSSANITNCIVVGYNDSPAIRFYASGSTPYITNTRYDAASNLLFSQAVTKFKYQSRNWNSLSNWQAYWATGEPSGNDANLGPSATLADATSVFADPMFAQMNVAAAPLRKAWDGELGELGIDLRPSPQSPSVGLGENLSPLGIVELEVDYDGSRRSQTGRWTVGAFNAIPR